MKREVVGNLLPLAALSSGNLARSKRFRTPLGVHFCRASPCVASAILGDTRRNLHCRLYLATPIRRQAERLTATEAHGLLLVFVGGRASCLLSLVA